MRRISRIFYFMMTVAFFVTPGAGYSDQIGSELAKQDARLRRPITLHAPRIYLNELVNKLSHQSGIALFVDPNDLISGTPLSVSIAQMPLVEVLNGIWSLMSYRSAELDWSVSQNLTTPPSYSLRSTARSRELAERLNQEAQKAFEDQAELMIRMSYMNKEERQRNVKRLSKTMLESGDAMAQAYLSPSADLHWDGIRFFAETLSLSQRLTVLRGGMVELPLEGLPSQNKKFLLAVHPRDQITLQRNGVTQTITNPDPDKVRFSLMRRRSKDQQLAPKLLINTVNPYGVSGQSYIGIMEAGLRRRVHANWILSGDAKTSALLSAPFEKSQKLLPDLPENCPTATAPLLQLAANVPLSYLAILPEETPLTAFTFGKTVRDAIAVLESDPYSLITKWRGNLLLANYPAWFYGDDAQVPQQLLKELRAEAKANQNYLTLKTIARVVMTLNESQIERLNAEFPGLIDAKQWSAFQLATNNPDVLTQQGTPITPERKKILEEFLATAPDAQNKSFTATRLNTDAFMQDGRRITLISLQVRTMEGKWIRISAVAWKPRNPPETSGKPKP